MSKKIAEGAQNLVIDLKVGEGAFIKDMEKARILGNLLKSTGENLGQKVSVIFTNMNAPLGEYIGNGLEVKETVEYLKGKEIADIDAITKALAIEMLLLSEVAENEKDALSQIEDVIVNGNALEKFRAMIIAQHGNGDVCDNTDLLPQAKYEIPIIMDKSGWIKAIDSQSIGYALIEIDAGRKTLDSQLNYGTGAKLTKKIGDQVQNGDVIGSVFADDEKLGEKVAQRIVGCYSVVAETFLQEKIILDKLK
jgi:pyrimidine-nucleoside phosphorylase